jgi:glycosyltransferase involved in cell wall biosynthesis
MKILHVATLITPDGAYGGPIRVALNQLSELSKRGHSVELVAGARGFKGALPTHLQGVPVRLFRVRTLVPGTGYAGLFAPGLRRYVRNRLKAVDLVHVHMARDLVTLPAAAVVVKHKAPLVLQTHGMIDESSKPLAAVIDAVYTRRLLRHSHRILTLTPKESDSLKVVATQALPVTAIPNGVEVPELAVGKLNSTEVLFLARLHPRKRASYFVEMANVLLGEGNEAKFVIIGPDEGDGRKVRELILKHDLSERVTWEGALAPAATLERMRSAAIYVLPSVDEVLPMSVLEAMSLGLPVVVTESNGLAVPLNDAGAGIVVDETLHGLVAGVRKLLNSEQQRVDIGHAARKLIENDYSISAVASQLEMIYSDAVIAIYPDKRTSSGTRQEIK